MSLIANYTTPLHPCKALDFQASPLQFQGERPFQAASELLSYPG